MKTFLLQRVGWSSYGDVRLREVHGVVVADKPEDAGEILGGKYLTPDEVYKQLGYDLEGHVSSKELPSNHFIKLSQGGVFFGIEIMSPSKKPIRGASPFHKTLEYQRREGLHLWVHEFEGYAILLLQEIPTFSMAATENLKTIE